MTDLMEAVTSLAKRRGIAFQSAEIYGGLRSSWDYGPLGVELRRNIRNAWWRSIVQLRDDVVGVEAAIVTSPRVWQASGHLETFHDPLVECTNCHQRFREDHLEADEGGVVACPNCGGTEFTEPKQFNLMLKTFLGPVEDDDAVAYLRPETAQGMFVNFAAIQTVSRKKVPFGIAQIGKSFRNEITPGNFIFRTREFEQMEIEYFVNPLDTVDGRPADEVAHDRWIQERLDWYQRYGLRADHLRLREHAPDELAHYAKRTVDIEYRFPMGWSELEGIANRTDFDLKQHSEVSGVDLRYFDQDSGERFFPYVIEPAAGATRTTFAILIDAYREEEVNDETRVVLRLDPRLAPYKVAVLPLSKKAELIEPAEKVATELRKRWMIEVDTTQSIGRRYRRQDEIGTPYCVTVDFESLEDQAVTVRDRDTMTQDRVAMDRLVEYLSGRLQS